MPRLRDHRDVWPRQKFRCPLSQPDEGILVLPACRGRAAAVEARVRCCGGEFIIDTVEAVRFVASGKGVGLRLRNYPVVKGKFSVWCGAKDSCHHGKFKSLVVNTFTGINEAREA